MTIDPQSRYAQLPKTKGPQCQASKLLGVSISLRTRHPSVEEREWGGYASLPAN